MWVARDKDKIITLFQNKPYRKGDYWMSDIPYIMLNESLFPNLKWEDEPIEIELIQKDIRKN